jgi:hypothetical protein
MSTSTSGRSKALWATGAIIAGLVLGCLPQVSPVLPATVADSARQGKMGLVRLRIGRLGTMRTAVAELQRVNRVKITVMSADRTFQTEEIVSLSLNANEAAISVPFGRNFVVFAQGLNDEAEVSGARIGGYFNIVDGNPVNVTVTAQTTPVADILRYLIVKSPVLAQTIDLPTLQRMVDQAAGPVPAAMINPQTFGDAIIAAKGLPAKAPTTARFASGRVTGTVEGLGKDEVAIITVSDPASRPYVLVGGSSAATGGTTTGETNDTYRIDNVAPGTWTIRIVAANAGADPVELVKTVTVGTPYVAPALTSDATASATATPTAVPLASPSGDGFVGPVASVDFVVKASKWATTAINASSNLGISDQPDAAIDGNDNIHLVWRQDFNPDLADSNLDATLDKNPSGAIFYSRWNGQNWSRENRNISVIDKQGARQPAVAVGVDRLPAVVWSGLNGSLREIRFSRFDGRNWSTPVSISSGIDSSFSAVAPDIAVDKITGNLYVVWQGGDGPYTYFREYYGNNWTPAKRVSSNGGTQPRIVTGYDGSIYITWVATNGTNIRFARYMGNSWEAGDTLPINLVNAAGPNQTEMTIDRQNRVHLIARSGTELQYFFGSAGIWTSVEKVDDQAVGSDVGSAPALHADPVGNMHLLYRDYTATDAANPTRQGMYYRRRTNKGWGSMESYGALGRGNLGTDATSTAGRDRPIILSDSLGRLHALWSQKFDFTVVGTNKQEVDIMHLIRTIADQ